MQILLLHLSDVHIRTGGESVLSRTGKIKDACHATAPNASCCVVVFSGDIAYSGLSAQYEAAYSFLSDLRDKLLELPSITAVEFVAVPGNHDCDFSHESDIRQYLLKDIQELYESGLSPASDRVKVILDVQQNFFAFEAKLTSGKEISHDQRLSYGRLVRFGNYSLKFQCYNTAWLSRERELQSKLFVLPEAMDPVAAEANVCAAIFHHPYNWLDANNYRLLKETVEQTSDLIFTGHEHQAGGGVIERFSGEHLHYLEAAALQGDTGELDSGFNSLLLDVETGEQRLEEFHWDGENYASRLRQNWNTIIINPARERHLFRLNANSLDELTDPGAPFFHKHKRKLRIDDIFVYPDFRQWSADQLAEGSNKARTINSREVVEYFRTTPKVLISGADDSGKTALLKKLFVDLGSDYVPIMLSAKDFKGRISESRFTTLITAAVEQYYDVHSVERFLRLDPSRRVLLIDDFHMSNFSRNNELRFMEFAQNMFGHIFVAADDIYRMADLSRKGKDQNSLKDFETCSIRECGHRLRAHLINKWLSLGRDTASELQAIEHEARVTEKVISSLLGKNVIPSTPFNILTLLHTMEASQPHAISDGSFGALYELLIKTSMKLASSGGPDDTELKFTYTSVIAYSMFHQERTSLGESDLRKVHEDFVKQFGHTPNFERTIEQLVSAKVLQLIDGNYSFKYKHFYYYFVALYFERSLKRKDDRAAILRSELHFMGDRLHSEELANIVLVYLYLTQDWELSKHILDNARRIYPDKDTATLDRDVDFVNAIYKNPPRLLLEDSDVAKNRERRNERLDEEDEKDGNLPKLDDKASYDDSLADIHKINISFKTLQVLGQVLRSSADSLEADVKCEIVTTCYLLGLRTLRVVLGIVEVNAEEIRLYLATLIKERAAVTSPDHLLTESDLLKRTDEALIWMAFACTFGTIKKISYAVGHHHLAEIYDRVLNEQGNPTSVKLIDLAIKLEHFMTVPLGDITQLRDRVVGNLFSQTLLRQLVVDFLHLYRTDFRTLQKLGSMFKIEGATGAAFLLPDMKRD
jgi:hypothetical protein